MAAQGLDMPVPTIAANGTHIGLAQPVIINLKKATSPGSAESPLPTVTSEASHLAVAEAFILNRHGDNGGGVRAHSVEMPMPTAVDRGAGYVVEPFVMSAAHGVDAGDPDPHSRRVRSIEEPIGAVHAGGGNFGVVEAFMLSRLAEGGPRSVDDPTPTPVAKHSHLLISPYYGSGSGDTCSSGEQPLPTVTAKARFGMVVPITHAEGGNRARNVDTDGLPTITTANRGELAFITAQFGEREGQAPRVHDIEDPAPTIAATGHVNLAVAGEEYDILFRMLEPHELAAAMGFTNAEATYEFAGNKTEQIKQIGNAVSVEMMEAEVGAIFADAVPGLREMRVAAE
jgi:DNA (cytosine-5)-methyltransferase 1